jgi:hypothetical protein
MLVAGGARALVLHNVPTPAPVSALAIHPPNAAIAAVDSVDPWTVENAPIAPVSVRTRTLDRVDPWTGAQVPTERTTRRLEIDPSDPWK